MGLLTILKKMKQKERELRLLMLYPPDAGAAGVAGPRRAGGAGRPLSGAERGGRRVPTAPGVTTPAPPIAQGAGRRSTPGLGLGPAPRAAEAGLQAQRRVA